MQQWRQSVSASAPNLPTVCRVCLQRLKLFLQILCRQLFLCKQDDSSALCAWASCWKKILSEHVFASCPSSTFVSSLCILMSETSGSALRRLVCFPDGKRFCCISPRVRSEIMKCVTDTCSCEVINSNDHTALPLVAETAGHYFVMFFFLIITMQK